MREGRGVRLASVIVKDAGSVPVRCIELFNLRGGFSRYRAEVISFKVQVLNYGAKPNKVLMPNLLLLTARRYNK